MSNQTPAAEWREYEIADAVAEVYALECRFETNAHAARLMEDPTGYRLNNCLQEQIAKARRELQRAHVLEQQFQRDAEMLRHTEG